MLAEHARLQQLLTAAERHFEKAEAALQRERSRVNAARSEAAAAHRAKADAELRAAQAEHDAAAQGAAAQHVATAAIEAELQERILDRGLMTKVQFVDYAQLKAALGMVSPPYLKVAAHVMAAECATAGKLTTLPSTSADGRGRGATYKRVVATIKPSDQLSPRQLYRQPHQGAKQHTHPSRQMRSSAPFDAGERGRGQCISCADAALH